MADWDVYNLPEGKPRPRPSNMAEWKDLAATKKVATPDGRRGAVFGDEWIFERLVECGVEAVGWNSLTSAKRERMKTAVRRLSLVEDALKRASHQWAPEVQRRALESLKQFNLWSKGRAERKSNFESDAERPEAGSPLRKLYDDLAGWLRKTKAEGLRLRRPTFNDLGWRQEQATACHAFLSGREGVSTRRLTCEERDIKALGTRPPTHVAAEILARAFPGTTADEVRRSAGAKSAVGKKRK